MNPYCSPCLDVWNIQPSRLTRGDWVNVGHGVALHVSCGRALEAIRTAPPLLVLEDDDPADWRWAA